MEVVACQHHQGIGYTPQGRAEATDGIYADLSAEHRQAHKGSRRFTAAQCIYISAKSGKAQDDGSHNQCHNGNQHPHGHKARANGQTEIRHGHKGWIRNIDGFPGNYSRQATAEQHACQGNDKWLQIEFGNDISLEGTKNSPHQQYQEDSCKYRNAGICQQPCQHHAGQGQYSAYGQINAAYKQWEGNAHCHNDQGCIVNKQIQENLGLAKALVHADSCSVENSEEDNGNNEGEIFGGNQPA